MKNNKNVIYLIGKGLSVKTVATLNESQIKVLVEKFKKSDKEESMEQVTKITEPAKEIINIGTQGGELPNNPTGKGYKVEKNPDGTTKATPMETEIKEDETDDVTSSNALGKDAEQAYTGQDSPHDANDMADDGMDDDSGDDRSNMGMAESTISEKFESKAQQGLFWARCNKCASKNCKWCKMAKEFSDKTSKKQYTKMPEKKHPEKTVKKKTNENLQTFLEKKISEMVDKTIKPKMTKKDLIDTIKKKSKKSESMILRKPKKMSMFSDEAPIELPIGKMFSIGKK